MSKLVYIASPYSHPHPRVRQDRFLAARRREDLLVSKGVNAYSPIAHNHERDLRGYRPPQGWLVWDFHMLAKADALEVLQIDGWRESEGVQEEIAFARNRGCPVTYATPCARHHIIFYLDGPSE